MSDDEKIEAAQQRLDARRAELGIGPAVPVVLAGPEPRRRLDAAEMVQWLADRCATKGRR